MIVVILVYLYLNSLSGYITSVSQLQNDREKKMKVLVTQSRPTLCDPMDGSLPGSSVHGILWARILQWVAMPSSRGSS